MPYKSVWVEAKKDEKMTVIPGEDVPEGFELREDCGGTRIASDASRTGRGFLHFCPRCKGWIAGLPNTYRENTLRPLSGREGRSDHCRRCGHEIGFIGKVS